MLCMVRQETWSHVLGLINVQSTMHIVFELYDVLRFDSTVVISVLINISSLQLNNRFFTFRVIVHKYATTPKAELFCSCKRRKFVGQNKVKICKLQSQSFKLLGQKIGCPSDHLNGNVSSYLNCLLLCLLVSIFV